MSENRNQKRILWNDPSAVWVAASAILVTTGIVAVQMSGRRGIFEPDTLTIFYRLFLFQDYPGSLLFILTLMVALIPSVQDAGTEVVRFIAAQNILLVAALMSCVFALGAWFVYQAHPLAMDEYAPYMQSEIFASGKLLGAFPPELLDWLVLPSFQGYFIQVDRETGSIASIYWPSFALLLAPFKAAGFPWLCNPLLAGTALVVIHRLAKQLTGAAVGAATAVLIATASAAFVINAFSFYSMTAHLLCNAAFVLLLVSPTPARVFLAGLTGGFALTLHNPVPHTLFAAPWLLWMLWDRGRRKLLPLMVLGYAPWIMVAGFGWKLLLQSLTIPAQGEGIALLERSPFSAGWSSLRAVMQWPTLAMVEARLIGFAKLWLWAVPGVLILCGIGAWRHRRNSAVRLLVASCALTVIGYMFVPFDQGHGWGFRYFHSAWFALPLLGAMALVPPKAGELQSHGRASEISRYAVGSAIASLLVLVPFFAWQTGSFIRSHIAQLPAAERGVPRVVIVNPGAGYYAQDLIQNDPFLRDPVIRMVTRGRDRDAQMIARHFRGLELLKRDDRGSVWGYVYGARSARSVIDDEHGKKERAENDIEP